MQMGTQIKQMADSRKRDINCPPDEIALLERYRGATAEGREAAMHALAV